MRPDGAIPERERRPAVCFGPFNAEAAWRDETAATLPELRDSQAQRIVAAMDELSFAFCEEGDVLLTVDELVPEHRDYVTSVGFRFTHAALSRNGAPAALPEELRSRLARARASPYAVVPAVKEVCARYGIGDELPPVEVVARVNSKTWSHRLASELSLFGAGLLVKSAEALAAEGRRLLAEGALVVKDPFGVSGKGSIVVRSAAELDRLGFHLRKQVEAGKRVELLVQPLYDRAVDFSCHFEVEPERLRVHGVQVMDNDGFAFSALRPATADLRELLERQGYWRVIESIARALEREGYRGPVCVDSMLLRDGTLVPLLEINARKSMGLLNHRLRARVGPELETRLESLNLTFEQRTDFGALLEAMRRRRLLYEGAGPGVLPLSARAVVANLDGLQVGSAARGRLYAALVVPDGSAAAALREALVACLDEAGVDVGRRRRA